MNFPYPGLFAIDPQDPMNVAANSELTIFDPADSEQRPIALTDSEGLPISNPILTNDKGFVGVFYSGLDEVGWSAGNLVGIVQSYQGIKRQAQAAAESAAGSLRVSVEAAESAFLAQQAAEQASNMVGAPADEAVKLLLENETLSQEAGDNRWVTNEGADTLVGELLDRSGSSVRFGVTKLADDAVKPILAATDPLAYLDNVKLAGKFPVRENGETSWVQGFTMRPEDGHYYVSNQQGTSLRIDRREIGTNERLTSRTVTTENDAFSETIDSFKNSVGDLIFVVWPKTMSFPGAYSLYNYTKNSLGPQIPINGLVRGARYGDMFVTCDTWGVNAPSKFFVYSWDSIKAGAPELLQEIVCKSYPRTPAKTQGMAYNDGFIFFAQGNQTENMTITAYNTRGQIELVKTYDRASLASAVNKLVPGLLTNPDYLFESEGAFVANGKLYTLQIVNNTPDVVGNAVALILEHNNIDGVKIESFVSPQSEVGPWTNVELAAGWTHQPSYPFQVRVNGNRVEFQGYAVNPTFVGGYTHFATLPPGIPKPKMNWIMGIPGNTVTVRSLSVLPGGTIEIYSSNTSGSWYGVCGGAYTY